MNSGLVFIKPHAVFPQVITFVEEYLQSASIIIEKTGVLTGAEIQSAGIIDRHYFSISKTAMQTKPAELHIAPDTLNTFREKFGINWEEALSSDLIRNSADYMKTHGIETGVQLTAVWSAGEFMKLGPGLYVCRVNDSKEFIINGFYPGMREKFTFNNARVHWYAVTFNENTLPWEKFRTKIIGATDPSKAEQGSIRNMLYSNYTEYGLTSQPSMSDNGIHASAGPIEGMRERIVWAGIDPETSELGTLLAGKGIGKSALDALLENGEAQFKDRKGPVFDITEDVNESDIISNLSVAE